MIHTCPRIVALHGIALNSQCNEGIMGLNLGLDCAALVIGSSFVAACSIYAIPALDGLRHDSRGGLGRHLLEYIAKLKRHSEEPCTLRGAPPSPRGGGVEVRPRRQCLTGLRLGEASMS